MNKKYPAIAAIALLLSAALSASVSAKGREELEQTVVAKLEAAKEALKLEGDLKLAFPPTVGQLTEGASAPYTMQLNAGTEYTIVALCDEDCSDINLSLTDMYGNEIAADMNDDDYPLITLTPPWTGRFQANAIVQTCSANFCYFGLGVFSK